MPVIGNFFATIDEKPLWGKKKTRQIRKEFAGFWHYVDTGKFTPGLTVNTLERAWEAQNGSIKKFKAQ